MSKMKKMTNKQMRMAVAEDILLQLKKRTKRMKVTTGTYCSVDNLIGMVIDNDWDNQDSAQPHIDKLQNGCEVCALGSMLLSHVRLFNKIDISSFYSMGGHAIKDHLYEYFSSEQLALIESAFEKWYGGTPKLQAASRFGSKYRRDKQRLTAIMENIVQNEGTFRP